MCSVTLKLVRLRTTAHTTKKKRPFISYSQRVKHKYDLKITTASLRRRCFICTLKEQRAAR